MSYPTMLATFGVCLLVFALWRDVLPLLERLVAVRERDASLKAEAVRKHCAKMAAKMREHCMAEIAKARTETTTNAGQFLYRKGETVRASPESLGLVTEVDRANKSITVAYTAQNPIAAALDDVCGAGEHTDKALRRHLNSVTVPKLKAEKLSDEEIADRLRDGAS